MIEVRDLRKSYGPLEVLKHVSFSVEKGEVVVVLGPSGSGKSTLLRCINHLEDYESGEIRIDGAAVGYSSGVRGRNAHSETVNARLREQVGMVFQSFNLFPHRTAIENVMMGPVHVRGVTKREARALAQALLDKVGLAEKADQYPAKLSGGQQQRVAIARALCMQPKIMLFDEPTSALDPEMVKEVLDTMVGLAMDGMTMLVVSHEMGFARQVASRMVLMDAGQIIEVNEPEAFFSHPQHERSRLFLSQILH